MSAEIGLLPPAAAPGVPRPRARPSGELRVSIVVPTFKERDNVAEVVARARNVMAADDWEIIFVDDNSPDGTADAVRAIAREDRRVRCLERFGRRGLAGACLEGMGAAAGEVVVVMDADLQHDETLLPQLVGPLLAGEKDIMIGSRFATGGSAEGLSSNARRRLSEVGIRLAQVLVGRHISDPFSGFFAVRRELLAPALGACAPIGFKILLDMLMVLHARGLQVGELAMRFRARQAGHSKLSPIIVYELVLMVLRNLLTRSLSLRFVSFCVIGGIGIFVHLAALALATSGLGLTFVAAQSLATAVAIFSNFYLNNLLTFSDLQLKGWSFLGGLAKFYVICAVGAVANVAVASMLHGLLGTRMLLASLAGIVVGAIWNYALSSRYTWADRL